MATDIAKVIENLLAFHNFADQQIISVGAGGGQFIAYGHIAAHVLAVDNDRQALKLLKQRLEQTQLSHKFTLRHACFMEMKTKADLVLFEFSLHEMENPSNALSHALSLAPKVLVADHYPGSEWAFVVDEKEKVETAWQAIQRFEVLKMMNYQSEQRFGTYDELYQKVSGQGERSLMRIRLYKEKQDFIIPMQYGFALL